MRSIFVCAAMLGFLSVSASAFAQQPDQPQQPPVNQDKIKDSDEVKPPATLPAPPVPPAQIGAQPAGDSLAAAARKAREARKEQTQSSAPRVFDNDTIPKQGGVSSVGAETGTSANGSDASAAGGTASAGSSTTPGGSDEKTWRERFAKLHTKLKQDQDALDIMQRELGVLDVQYYNDPQKALQQNLTRSDINAKTAKIDQGRAQVEADKQAISDAEDELRKSGGDIGWSR